jgi:hypothetical protein
MPLSGDAKTRYQRDYMRQRRAGAKSKSKAAPKPTAAETSRLHQLEGDLARERIEHAARGLLPLRAYNVLGR